MKSTKGLSFIVFDNSLAKFEPIQMTPQSHLWFFLRKGHDHIFTICNLDACINVMKSSFDSFYSGVSGSGCWPHHANFD